MLITSLPRMDNALDCKRNVRNSDTTSKTTERNKMASPIMKYFNYEHLPEHLQQVSQPIFELAWRIESEIPDSAEKSAGLRKLLEAKDCFVRAKLT